MVVETGGKECNCPACGAWMMRWTWEKHLRGNFCEMYLSERKEAAPAALAPVVVFAPVSLPVAA